MGSTRISGGTVHMTVTFSFWRLSSRLRRCCFWVRVRCDGRLSLLRSFGEDFGEEIRQESIETSPRFFPKSVVIRSLVRRDKVPPVCHYQQDVLQAFRDSFLLRRCQTDSRSLRSGLLTRLSPCPLFINRSMMSRIRSHRSSIPSHSESSTR